MYKFIHVDEFSGDEVTLTIQDGELDWLVVVGRFQDFLRGCSYKFFDKMDFIDILGEKQDELRDKLFPPQAFDSGESVRLKKSATSASEKLV